jgi:hypothetical protein
MVPEIPVSLNRFGFLNSAGFGTGFGKTGQKSGFSLNLRKGF